MRVILNLFVCFSLCGFYSCKTTTSDLDLINSLYDTNNFFPEVVPIETIYKDDFGMEYISRCTASIISHNALLTAAHCLKKTNNKEVYIIEKSGAKIPAKATYVMDEYAEQASISKDVGIVVFANRTFSAFTPFKISNRKVKNHEIIVYVGYGDEITLTENGVVDLSRNLERKWGRNYVLSESCNVVGMNNCFITGTSLKNMSADPNKKQDPLGDGVVPFDGDSGGPILLEFGNNIIVGIVSQITVVDDVVYGVNLTFDDSIIEWLKRIDQQIDANISFDQIE